MIKEILFLIAMLTISLSGIGQDLITPKVDSLESLIKLKSGTEKFDAILALMRVKLKYNPEDIATLELSQQAERVALQTGDSLRIVKARYARGYIYRHFDSLRHSLRVLEQVLPIAKRNHYNEELSKILNSLAIVHTKTGNIDKALEIHFQSIGLNEQVGNKEDLGITYNNIGVCYFKLMDFENALKYYKKSIEVKKEIADEYDLGRLLVNMALCYTQLKRFKEAEDKINEAITSCKSDCSLLIMEAELALGIAAYGQKRKKEAIYHFESSLAIARKINDKYYQVENLWNLALARTDEKHADDALRLVREAERMATEINLTNSLIEIYRLSSRIYQSKNDLQKAFLYLSKYTKINDSIYSINFIKNISRVEANFAQGDKLKEIEEKTKLSQSLQRVIDSQKKMIMLIVMIELLSIGGLIYLFIQNRRLTSKMVS